MSTQIGSVDLLADLRAQEAECEARLRDLRAAISAIRSVRGVEQTVQAADPPFATEWRNLSASTLRDAVRGKSIADATIALLAIVNQPVADEELLEGLQIAGVTFVSKNPLNGFRFALITKSKETGQLTPLSNKTWGLATWGHRNGVEMRVQQTEANREAAIERGRLGLQAARARGVRLGKPPKIKDEDIPKIVELLDKNVPVSEIAIVFDMSRQGMYTCIKRLRDAGKIPERLHSRF